MTEIKVLHPTDSFPDVTPLEQQNPLSDFLGLPDFEELTTPTGHREAEKSSRKAEGTTHHVMPNVIQFPGLTTQHAIPRFPRVTAYLPIECRLHRSLQEQMGDYAQSFFLRSNSGQELDQMRCGLIKSGVPESILDTWEKNVKLIGGLVRERLSRESIETGLRTLAHHVMLPLLYSVDDHFNREIAQ